jgi:hypothetical protein
MTPPDGMGQQQGQPEGPGDQGTTSGMYL